MNIKKAILKVFSANFLQLITTLIIGFVVPTVLSISQYASLKTYTLYISYIGLLHLGFIDGLYIKYGGKKYEEINKGELKSEHRFLIISQLIVTAIFLITGMLFDNIIILLFSFSIIPVMISAFFKYIYQATGEFKKYTKIVYTYSLSYLLLNILLSVIFKCDNYIYYCLITIICNIISIIVFEYRFIKDYNKIKICNSVNYFNIMKSGFFVLLGNLSVIGLFGIDKWFVKLFFSVNEFAYYSFAVSMLNIINILVNAVSVTFYNYLFSNNNKNSINNLKNYLICLGGFASCAYFPLAFIVDFFMPNYIPSLSIISITFAVFPYMILFNALYVNLYKVNKQEKKYFKIVISMLVLSIIYNIIALIIFKNVNAIAYATIISMISVIIFTSNDLKIIDVDIKMYIYLILLTISFLLITHYFNWIYGGILYFIVFIILTLLIGKIKFKDIIKFIKYKN